MKRGFTLVEMMVVIFIIALLASAIVVSTQKARIQGRNDKRIADLQAVAGALEIYYAQNKYYPQLNDWQWNELKNVIYPTYFSSWPSDPTGGDGEFGKGYVYSTNDVSLAPIGSYFVLDTTLEGDETVTESTIDPENRASNNFFKTGVYEYQGKKHFRLSGR